MRAIQIARGAVISVALVTGSAGALAMPALANDTIPVNSTGDAADADLSDGGICDADAVAAGPQCTLRAAIQTANADADEDTITFSFGGTAVKRIPVPKALPRIVEPLVIDGFSAPNTSPNTRATGSDARLRVVLKGPGNRTFNGLQLAAPTTVRGLVVESFWTGIFVGSGGEGSLLSGNFIGTTPSGLGRAGNRAVGIHVDCEAAVTIGGASKAARNIIAANSGSGVLTCEDVVGTVVIGNLIGIGADGRKDLGNAGAGIYAFGTENLVIGGDAALERNAIAFNDRGGVVLTRAEGDHTIAFGVSILGNSIFRNAGQGIDLDRDGVTPNDGAGDSDGGSNHSQNYPSISSARNANGDTVVRGKLFSEPDSTFQVRLFVDTFHEREGKKYLKTITLATNADGKAWWSTVVPDQRLGTWITATATNVTRAPAETSEFSGSRQVVKP